MLLLKKIISIWMIGKTVSSATAIFTRLLMGMVVIALLAAFAIVFIILILGGIIWVSYMQLTLHGFDPSSAVMIIIALGVAMLAVCIYIVKHYVNKVAEIARMLLLVKSDSPRGVTSVVTAFMDGLNTSVPRRHR